MPFFCEKDAQVIIANASTQLPINTLREVLSLIVTACYLDSRYRRGLRYRPLLLLSSVQ